MGRSGAVTVSCKLEGNCENWYGLPSDQDETNGSISIIKACDQYLVVWSRNPVDYSDNTARLLAIFPEYDDANTYARVVQTTFTVVKEI